MITVTFFVVRCFNRLVLKSRLNKLYTLIFLLARLKVTYALFLGFPGSSVVKKLPAVQEIQVQSRGWEDPLGEEMAASTVFLPGNPMHRGAWQATVHGVADVSDTI